MSKEFSKILRGEDQPSLAETLKEVGGQLWDATKPMFDHGRTEIGAFLFQGNAGHVMYMRGQEGIEQGQDQAQSPEQIQQKENDGREM